jgi:hypothetical protein
MIFENEKCFIIKNNTRNNTNTKDYSSLSEDYVFESTFKYLPTNNGENIESCVLGRSGYNFGIYVYESENIRQKEKQFNSINNTIKWVWFKEENGQIIYDNLFFGFNNDDHGYLNHLNWWKKFIIKESPIELDEQTLDGLSRRWGFFDGTFELNEIKNTKILEWVNNIDEGKNKTGSYLTEIVKVTVKKVNGFFELFVNDIFYTKKMVGNIVNINDKTICVAVGDPYKNDGDKMYFNGEIFEVKIFDTSENNNNSLYCWLDFNKKTHFKVFDKSLNGNHAELFESEEFKNKKNIEFNQFSRPPKIL